MKIENTIVIGNIGSGKTTKLINMLKDLLVENPNLKIGVSEEIPEIENSVPEVISTKTLSSNLDLFVCTHDFYLVNVANSMNIPVWCEIYGDEKVVARMEENVPGIEKFKRIYCQR